MPGADRRTAFPTPAAVALGSNLGDRMSNLDRAAARLERLGCLAAMSSVYETAPVGRVPQGPFYNAAVVLETRLEAEALLDGLLEIERGLGRVRGERWGPRLIDLDLILHGSTVLSTDAVTVPHPRYRERRFVLAPLVDAWPEARDPDGTPAADLLARTADLKVRRLKGLGGRWGARRYCPVGPPSKSNPIPEPPYSPSR